MPVTDTTTLPPRNRPRQVPIRLDGRTVLTVQRFHDGSTTLIINADAIQIEASMCADAAAELVAAISPRVADLAETLELLAEAADALVPSPMVHGRLTAEERECRDRIADARKLLVEG